MLARSAIAPRRKNAPRLASKSAPAFLQWLRGRECVVRVGQCQGKIEAAHVDYAGGKGMGTKVRDSAAVPMCSYHHRTQHSLGWPEFEKAYLGKQGYALEAAASYWNAWSGRFAWERKMENRP